MANNSTLELLCLPNEILLEILSHALPCTVVDRPHDSNDCIAWRKSIDGRSTEVLRTCKTMHDLGEEKLYKENTFPITIDREGLRPGEEWKEVFGPAVYFFPPPNPAVSTQLSYPDRRLVLQHTRTGLPLMPWSPNFAKVRRLHVKLHLPAGADRDCSFLPAFKSILLQIDRHQGLKSVVWELSPYSYALGTKVCARTCRNMRARIETIRGVEHQFTGDWDNI